MVGHGKEWIAQDQGDKRDRKMGKGEGEEGVVDEEVVDEEVGGGGVVAWLKRARSTGFHRRAGNGCDELLRQELQGRDGEEDL